MYVGLKSIRLGVEVCERGKKGQLRSLRGEERTAQLTGMVVGGKSTDYRSVLEVGEVEELSGKVILLHGSAAGDGLLRLDLESARPIAPRGGDGKVVQVEGTRGRSRRGREGLLDQLRERLVLVLGDDAANSFRGRDDSTSRATRRELLDDVGDEAPDSTADAWWWMGRRGRSSSSSVLTVSKAKVGSNGAGVVEAGANEVGEGRETRGSGAAVERGAAMNCSKRLNLSSSDSKRPRRRAVSICSECSWVLSTSFSSSNSVTRGVVVVVPLLANDEIELERCDRAPAEGEGTVAELTTEEVGARPSCASSWATRDSKYWVCSFLRSLDA